MEKRRQPETIAGRVNADGSIAAGDGFTVTKTGTGTYTVAFGAGFRLVGLSAASASGSSVGGGITTSAYTERSVGIVMFTTNTAASVDAAFSFVAVGQQQ